MHRIVRRGGQWCAGLLAGLCLTQAVQASPVAYEFSTTLNLNLIAGPATSNVLFHIEYDPALAGTISSGFGNTHGIFSNGVTGAVYFDGVEVGTLYSQIILDETITLDAATILFSQEAGNGAVNNYTDQVPYFYDINQIRLSFGDNTRNMLSTATALPANLNSFSGVPWSVQFDIYGPNASSFGGVYGVRVINSAPGQNANWVSAGLLSNAPASAVPVPASAGAAVLGLGILSLRNLRRRRH